MSSFSLPPIRHEGACGVWSVDLKPWDSEFFARPIASLTWERQNDRIGEPSATVEALRAIVEQSDHAGFSIVECDLDVADLAIAWCLEEVGFRLVDSRIQFLTRFTRADIPDAQPTRGEVVDAAPWHRERIVELIHTGFTRNDHFISRFKNAEYFTPDETRRYYEAWFDNTAFASGAACAVFVDEGSVAGFYVYQARDEMDGLPVMKATLTAVDPEFRGAGAHVAMQAYLYRKLSRKFGWQEWYVDNTTQLTNTPVVRNHIASGKQPRALRLTFFRRHSG